MFFLLSIVCFILLLQSYAGLKDALKVCAAYRGTYLDTKDKADDINTEKVSETAEAMYV